MKLPLKWLKEYVDFNVTPEKFVELMMWRGFEIAEIIDEMPGISNVVVGRIEKIEQHPNADKLKICTLNIGAEENLIIITGAPNVFDDEVWYPSVGSSFSRKCTSNSAGSISNAVVVLPVLTDTLT